MLALVSFVLLVATACGDDDQEAGAAPRRTTTTARETTNTLSPEEAERQQVIAAYEAAIEAEADSSSPPDPNPSDPAIAATHTGLMLDYWISVVEGLQAAGHAHRFPEESQHRVDVDSVTFDEVDGQRVAYLEVCTVTDQQDIVVATGGVVGGELQTIQASAAMRHEDDVWKLAEYRVNTTMQGVAGCAVE